MKKLIALNLVGLTLVVGLAAWLLQNARSSSRALTEVAEFTAVQRDADEIRTQMITMSDAMRGFLLNPSNRDEFERKKAADRELAQAVDRLMSETDNATYIELAKKIGDLDELKLDRIEDRVLELTAHDPKAASAAYFGEYLPVRVEQMALVEKLRTRATEALEAQIKRTAGEMSWTASLVSWMGAVVVLIMIAAFVWSARTTRHVQTRIAHETATMFEAANGVLHASRIASQSAHSLSQGASEQAASLEETSASMTEMASVTRKNAENSQEAAVLMSSMDNHVRVSNAALAEMVASMKALQESSEQVAKIIKTIDDIAFQTNLLALNAAVEAARAGDAGMGFAIVADEVRSLAQRSAQAAKDTEGLIESSLEKTVRGNEKVSQVATAIADITSCVVTVKGLVESVSQATQQQSQGIDQVAQAVGQMEKITQTNAATAEESAASGEELHAKAQTALDVVRRLEALVDVDRNTASTKPAAVAAPPSSRQPAASRIAAERSRRAA